MNKKIADYDMDIKYRTGAESRTVDAQSRMFGIIEVKDVSNMKICNVIESVIISVSVQMYVVYESSFFLKII